MITQADINYIPKLEFLKEGGISNEGQSVRAKWQDGTPAYTKSAQGVMFKYDNYTQPFTMLKDLPMKMSINEMLWIYQLQSNRLEDLHQMGITWWDQHVVKNPEPGFENTIGAAYGYTIAKYGMMDELLYEMEDDPFSRRHIMNMWQLDCVRLQRKMGGLQPCAYETLWKVDEIRGFNDKRVRLVRNMLVQRSQDFAVTLSINPLQYYALGLAVASHLHYHTGIEHRYLGLAHAINDLHIYDRHFGAVDKMIEFGVSESENFALATPRLELPVVKDFYDITVDDFVLPDLSAHQRPYKLKRFEIAE